MIAYENLKKVNEPFFSELRAGFDKVLESGWYITGKSVEKFEKEFAAYCGSKYCIGVNSGLDALTLSLASLDLNKGDEVIVPSNTYIATILAIMQNGLVPVLVEPDIEDYNICPEKIKDAITDKTKVIMVVHLYGRLCRMAEILEIAKNSNLKVIEDAAQAHGASFEGKKSGSFGHFGAFSFYPTKNLGALGDGGAVVTDDEEFAARIRQLRNYGSSKKYYNDVVGYNSRLDEMQAEFLSIKLKHLDSINQHKRELAGLYREGLSKDFILPKIPETPESHVHHIFNIRHSERDKLKSWLLEKGVGSEIHYPVAPHDQKALKGLTSERFEISELIHSTTLSLPLSFAHSKEDVLKVVEVLRGFGS